MSKKKVLIVEDSSQWQEDLSRILAESGHEVIKIAATAEEAIAAVKTHKPDVITIDGRLVGKASGLQVAQEIRTFDQIARIIMISSLGEKFEGVGIDKGYFDRREFLSAIEGEQTG